MTPNGLRKSAFNTPNLSIERLGAITNPCLSAVVSASGGTNPPPAVAHPRIGAGPPRRHGNAQELQRLAASVAELEDRTRGDGETHASTHRHGLVLFFVLAPNFPLAVQEIPDFVDADVDGRERHAGRRAGVRRQGAMYGAAASHGEQNPDLRAVSGDVVIAFGKGHGGPTTWHMNSFHLTIFGYHL